MIGVQIPILVGILEYATLLTLKKYCKGKEKSPPPIMVSQFSHPAIFLKDNLMTKKTSNERKLDWDIIEKNMDKWTFIVALAFIVTFNFTYWVSAVM